MPIGTPLPLMYNDPDNKIQLTFFCILNLHPFFTSVQPVSAMRINIDILIKISHPTQITSVSQLQDMFNDVGLGHFMVEPVLPMDIPMEINEYVTYFAEGQDLLAYVNYLRVRSKPESVHTERG